MHATSARAARCEATLRRAIDSIDLDLIKMKLTDPNEGPGWSAELADRVEPVYRNHLFLNGKYPQRSIVPTKLVDTFWHQHILDTRKYARDCERVFGYFLHHFPYFGLRGEEDAANLRRAFDETQELYEDEFGVSIFSALADPHFASAASYCGGNSCTGTGPQNCSSRRSPSISSAECTSGSCSKSCSGCTGGGNSSCSGCK